MRIGGNKNRDFNFYFFCQITMSVIKRGHNIINLHFSEIYQIPDIQPDKTGLTLTHTTRGQCLHVQNPHTVKDQQSTCHCQHALTNSSRWLPTSHPRSRVVKVKVRRHRLRSPEVIYDR